MATQIFKSEIGVGDRVRIQAQGATRTGIVTSVYRDWETGDYDIELTDPRHGAVYYKQTSDGGSVTILDRLPRTNFIPEDEA